MADFDGVLDESDELEAINEMLSAIGESPVNTLDGEPNADVSNCRRILAKINRTIQSKGWTFNIEEGVVLAPDSFSGLIEYLDSYLKLTVSGGSVYINRGGYLYDRTTKTDVFTSSVTVDLIRLKPYSEMPECFKNLIVTKAARRFNIRFFGAGELDADLQTLEEEAWADCQTYELDYGNFNMIDGDSFVGGIASR